MILVDHRVGSAHYEPMLGKIARLERLESADIAFMGRDGITVGIEIKKILDAVNCMYSGRLADHQIPLMKESYDICYLIVEGLWRPEPGSGILQYYKGELGKWGRWQDVTNGRKRLMYSSFESWLTTMAMVGGMSVKTTSYAEVTAGTILALYNWWQRADHHSFSVLQELIGDSASLSRPSMMRRMIALLPRIGWERSGELVGRFASVREMCEAPAEKWLIPNGIGMETARRIVEALNGLD